MKENFLTVKKQLLTAVMGLFLFATPSCATEDDKKALDQMKEVLALHDEAMPRMSDISKLVAELKPLADSSEAGETYQQAIHDLQKAHEDMMDWMKDFGSRFTPDEILKGASLSEEKTKWLEEEMKKMQEIKKEMEESISNARKLLEQ